MISPSHIEQVRTALAELHAAKARASDARRRLSELKMQQHHEDGERERIRQEEERDAATRLLDGDAAAPPKIRRANRLLKLDTNAPALAAAIREQNDRVSAAEADASLPEVPLVSAVLDIVAAVQGDGVDQARVKLAELALAAARLIAADQIRSALIGDRFPVPRGRTPPFAGFRLVQVLTEAIPERIRPPELAETQLLDAAREISSDIIKQIKG